MDAHRASRIAHRASRIAHRASRIVHRASPQGARQEYRAGLLRHPAMRWAADIYRLHRGHSAELPRPAQNL
jgi:hypothetical protein